MNILNKTRLTRIVLRTNVDMRVYINGRLSAFQAEDMGSIPVTRRVLAW